MPIKLGRVDYRLLHGIVATQWAPQLGAQRVMVIDDRTANDPIVKGSMRLGKPAGMACSIITLETALTNFKAGKYNDHSVFVVAATPEIFLELQKIGQKIPTLILGLTKGDETATQVSKRAAVTEAQKPVYKQIIENGTPVLVKFTPQDKDVQLDKIMEL